MIYKVIADYDHCSPMHPNYYVIAQSEKEAKRINREIALVTITMRFLSRLNIAGELVS